LLILFAIYYINPTSSFPCENHIRLLSPAERCRGYRNSLRPSILPSDIFVRSISQKVFEVSTWNFICG
jgi:hypothetical protein